MSFTPQTLEGLKNLWATAASSQPDVEPFNTDAGSSAGPVGDAAALLTLFAQNENMYVQQLLRMSSIPPLLNGQPNPDLDSFVNPFGVTRLDAIASSGSVTCSTPSPVGAQLVVPANAIIQSANGVSFQIQPNGAGYSVSLGGYPINTGGSSVIVPVLCLTAGIVGNLSAGTQFTATGAPVGIPGISSITNAAAFTNGVNVESDPALKTRFTITVSSGRTGTAHAIIAAVLAIQTGLIYSYGDRVNADGSAHAAYFTFIVNAANTGVVPSSSLLSAAQAAIEAVRPAGISYQCIAPTLVPVNGVGTIIAVAGYDHTAVQNAVNAQYIAFVNAIGLNPGTTPTVCSLARCYAALLQTQINGVNVVQDVQGLTLNGSAADVTANFASQLVAGTTTFTVS